jgi:hypothetical protein
MRLYDPDKADASSREMVVASVGEENTAEIDDVC